MEIIFEILGSLVAPALQVLVALTVAYLVTLWITLIIWTFRDIEGRSRSVITQVFATLLVVFFFLPGALLYLILRPKETLDEAFQRALQEEYMLQDLEELPLCPTCRHYVQADYVLCPQCHTRLRETCPVCERLVELRWNVCPYCTTPLTSPDEGEMTTEGEAVTPVALPDWVSPALQRLRARVLGAARSEAGWLPGRPRPQQLAEGQREPAAANGGNGARAVEPELAARDARPRQARRGPLLVTTDGRAAGPGESAAVGGSSSDTLPTAHAAER